MGFSALHLTIICPRCLNADVYAPMLWLAMQKAEIVTVTRAAAFIAQLAHESGEFRYSEEIGTGAIYEGRADLGNLQQGDGCRFKGRGFIQITGRFNYRRYGFEMCPEKAAEPENAANIAAQYWVDHKCNELADDTQFLEITRRINGGLNGIDNRRLYYLRALEVLGANSNI